MEKKYQGEGVDVAYNLRRCIHAEVCVHNLRQVFDPQRRPWIDATQAPADAIVDVVSRCPSGALHAERTDGGAQETPADRNTGILWSNGPIAVQGDLRVEAAGVNDGRHTEMRVTLCRCGASKNKPYCDNSHKGIAWAADDNATAKVTPLEATTAPLTIIAHRDGPYEVNGPLSLSDSVGEIVYAGEQTWLCRCGASKNKPFCDGSHHAIPFRAE
jgi:CDGSH-type Zn-finger protein/uncharacterized Fe-S cluster protein YjdI